MTSLGVFFSLSLRISCAAQHAVGVFGLGTGRLVPTAAAVAGLISVTLGGFSLARPAARTGPGGVRPRAVFALILGLISAAVGGLHAANAAGGFGTGHGLAGAIAALALGAVGVSLGGLAVIRSRRRRGTD